MVRLKLHLLAVFVLGTVLIAGCLEPKAGELTCSDTKDGDFAQFPSRYDSSRPQFRFELDTESILDGTLTDNDQDYWIWGGEENAVDGDVLRARWDNLTIKTVIDGSATTCNFCATMCGNLAVPPFEFSKLTLSEIANPDSTESIDTFFSYEGCPGATASNFNPDRDGIYALSYTSESCGEVLTKNRVRVIHNKDQATVTYPLEVRPDGKFTLTVTDAERFSPRLRVSRVVLSAGSCRTEPGSGRHCEATNGNVQRLYVVRANTSTGGDNASFGIRDSEDGDIDLTKTSINYLDSGAGVFQSIEATPAFLHSADSQRVVWQLELDPSTPPSTGNFVATFTLVPRDARFR